MKKFYILILLNVSLLINLKVSFAQIPSGFNYQAIIRNNDGVLLANHIVELRFSLIDNNSISVFSDSYPLNTNEFGLINIVVGESNIDFENIDWTKGPYELKVEIDSGDGFQDLGNTKILAVPYSNLAKDVINKDDEDANPLNELQTLSFNPTTNELSISNGNTLTIPSGSSDADPDPNNEIQILSKSGNEITLSKGGGTILDNVEDGDSDITNELQTLSIYGNILGISDGNMVNIPIFPIISDIDEDTKIMVEKNPDEDIIRFETNGKEHFEMNNGRLIVKSTGNSVFVGQKAGKNDDLSNNHNTFLGYFSGSNNTVGENNTAIGSFSFGQNEVGSKNIALGYRSQINNFSGNSNIAIGNNALATNSNISSLVAIGDSSLFNNGLDATEYGDGVKNTAIGSKSLLSNTIGDNNTAVGYNSLSFNIDGRTNTACGSYSLWKNNHGSNNTAFGTGSLQNNTLGANNTANGTGALYLNSTGNSNLAFGFVSLYRNDEGNRNIAIGNASIFHNIDKSDLIAIGDSALYNNGIGSTLEYHATRNIAIGTKAMYLNTLGDNNTATGYLAMYSNTSGYYNSAYGARALNSNSTGKYNTAIGTNSLIYNITGNYNTANGEGSLFSNTSGHSNVAIGHNSLKNNKTKSNLVAVGDSALFNNQNWSGAGLISYSTKNTAIGSKSMFSNTKGESNTATGYQTLLSNNIGYSNSAFGTETLFSNTSGNDNTAIGYRSLHSNNSGNQNTSIGAYSGHSNNGIGNIFIGYKAGYGELGDNKLFIDNSPSKYPLVYGDFSVDKLGINGILGIETTNPQTEIHIMDTTTDSDDDVTIRLQSYGPNKDGIIEFYEGGAAAMSIHYSGTTNSLSLIDLAQNPNAKVITFERNGDVGIGKENPTHLLDVGNSGAYCDGGAWVDGSSREYKTNIKSLTTNEAVLAFNELEPVRFQYKADPNEENLGFIAEDVPDLVATKDRKGVTPMDFVAVLTKVMQKQQDDIKILQNALQIQQQENTKLTKRIDRLENHILNK